MELIGILAGSLTLVAFLPQTVKTIRTRQTKDLSFATFLVICISAVLWTIFGLGKSIPSIWITNAVVAACTLIVLIVKLTNKET